MDARLKKEVEAFHKKNRAALEAMAAGLREAGILRVHFGLDFNNDEPDLGEYASIEYAEGRTEELEEWPDVLDQELMWAFPLGSGAYTFDAATARVQEDAQGGLIDVMEGVARAYHSADQRQKLEVEAEEFNAEMEAFIAALAEDEKN